MASNHPSERTQIAKLAAHLKWAGTRDRTAATAAARKAFNDQFVAQAREKYGDLPDGELAIAAGHLRKAYYANLARKSAQTRRARAAARQTCPGAPRCNPEHRCPEHHVDRDPDRAGEVLPEVVDAILEAGQESA